MLVKISSEHVPNLATSTEMATICLQIAALAVSSIFAIYLLAGGKISPAVLANLCLGGDGWTVYRAAEIGYFYLFGNFTAGKSLQQVL
ncbi:MAG: hypothetical protein CM1200mP18_09170 [Gammaproteobacteria bacterium]|nr:MAG: hypothetical protein CM1200mP18_09170 [Gammaproteobacteria bacterium]